MIARHRAKEIVEKMIDEGYRAMVNPPLPDIVEIEITSDSMIRIWYREDELETGFEEFEGLLGEILLEKNGITKKEESNGD